MDEILGCGGCMATLADARVTVATLVLFGNGKGADAGRREASCASSEILGTSVPTFAGLPENAGDTVPLGDVIGIVEKAIRAASAASVLVCHGGNLNIDHQVAFRATMTALRPAPGLGVKAFLTYEIASSTDWTTPGFDAPFRPNYFADIEPGLERKLAALSQAGADCRPWPHARSIEAVRNLALARGASVGIGAAEAFSLERFVASIPDPDEGP
jgi:LmbE family N-acetylglucosaminyl deacetylase